MPNIRFGIRLGPVAARIVDAIQRAGTDGIETEDLFQLIYRDRPGRNRSALKGYIKVINDKFDGVAPVRICMRQGRYLLRKAGI